MQSFEEALIAKSLQLDNQYAINGTLAHAMRWKGDNDTIRKKVTRAFEPVKESIQRLSDITRGGRGGRLYAPLESIITKIFPLIVSKHRVLQYYIDLWYHDHPQDDSMQRPQENRSVSPASSTSMAVTNRDTINVKILSILLIQKQLKLNRLIVTYRAAFGVAQFF